jgi:hypothetical protein
MSLKILISTDYLVIEEGESRLAYRRKALLSITMSTEPENRCLCLWFGDWNERDAVKTVICDTPEQARFAFDQLTGMNEAMVGQG